MATEHRDRNNLQKYALLIGAFALAAVIGSAWMGWPLTLGLLVGGAVLVSFSLNMAPQQILKWQGARKLDRYYYSELYETVNALARRAGLTYSPELYIVRNQVPNAFALGSKDRPIIGMTTGLISMLGERELQGVLAHEISHIKNNDLFIKGLALSFGNLTNTLSFVGRIMLLFTLPLLLMGIETISFMAVLALIFSPTLNVLLQLGLSRTMEFVADHDAAEITRDPLGLASALQRIDMRGRRWWQSLNPVNYRSSDWLKSHPDTNKRIERLKQLAREYPAPETGKYHHPIDNFFAPFTKSVWI